MENSSGSIKLKLLKFRYYIPMLNINLNIIKGGTKMSKKTMKIISVLAIIVCIVMAVTPVFALTPVELKNQIDTTNTDGIGAFGGKLMGVIQTVGVVIAVVVLMVLGIKYMMGSAEEKAEYKKTMMPYVIGAVLIFAASTIANVIYNFAAGI